MRLRTAAMKLPKWSPSPGPRLAVLVDSGSGSCLVAPLGIELVAGDGARLQVEDVADLLAVIAHSVLQAAHLEDQLRVAVVEDGDLRVGRLALVAVAEAAAQAEDAPRQGGAGDDPAGDVHLVHALVADVAVAEIPEPVPVVVDQVGVERLLCGRPQPEVEIHLRRRLADDRLDADAAARLVAQAARDQQLAELARLDHLGNAGPGSAAAALRAVLHDAVVLAGGLDGDPALVDVVAARLLDVDVLAGLAGPDGHQGVPVVGRGDGDGVEVLVFEGLADVLDRPRACCSPLLTRSA